MRFKTLLTLIILLSTLLVTSSCDKYQAKKLSGTYKCEVEYSYWDMTPTNLDTTFTEEIEITRNGKDLFVFENSIHIDKLKNGQEYQKGSGQNYFSVTFNKKNETVQITRRSGGQGGGSTSQYFGIKQ